jgi:O-antigen/teichoic acid export membrane protein
VPAFVQYCLEANGTGYGDPVQRQGLVVTDIVGYAVSRLIPAVLSVATVLALTRFLGVLEYGRFALVASAANTASVIGSGWLTQSILRFASGQRDWYQVHLPLIWKGFLVSAVLGIAVVTPGLGLTVDDGIGFLPLLFAGILACVLSSHALILALLQAGLQVRGFAFVEASRAVGVLAFSIAIISFGLESHLAALGGTIVALVCSTALGFVLVRLDRPVQSALLGAKTVTDRVSLPAFLRYGIPLSGWLGLSIAMPFVERVLIQKYTDAQSLGVYAALYDLVFRGSGMVIMPIVLALHPRIMAFGRTGDEAGARHLIVRGIGLQVLASAFLVLCLWVAGSWIVDLAIGPQVGSHVAYQLVIPLGISGCVWHIALLSHKLLECRGRTGVMTVAMALAILVTIGFNVFALPTIGVVATAYASAIGGALYCLVVAILSASSRPSSPGDERPANV